MLHRKCRSRPRARLEEAGRRRALGLRSGLQRSADRLRCLNSFNWFIQSVKLLNDFLNFLFSGFFPVEMALFSMCILASECWAQCFRASGVGSVTNSLSGVWGRATTSLPRSRAAQAEPVCGLPGRSSWSGHAQSCKNRGAYA